jgi:hypothetical protein
VAPGASSTFWPVYYLSGFGHTDTDHWRVGVILKIDAPSNQIDIDGKEFFNETANKACELAASDAGKEMTFVVDGAGFRMNPPSGSCFDKWKTSLGYNSLAFVRLRSNFKQDILGATLRHRYSGDKTYEYEFGDVNAGQQSIELEVMEFFTGASHPG